MNENPEIWQCVHQRYEKQVCNILTFSFMHINKNAKNASLNKHSASFDNCKVVFMKLKPKGIRYVLSNYEFYMTTYTVDTGQDR